MNFIFKGSRIGVDEEKLSFLTVIVDAVEKTGVGVLGGFHSQTGRGDDFSGGVRAPPPAENGVVVGANAAGVAATSADVGEEATGGFAEATARPLWLFTDAFTIRGPDSFTLRKLFRSRTENRVISSQPAGEPG